MPTTGTERRAEHTAKNLQPTPWEELLFAASFGANPPQEQGQYEFSQEPTADTREIFGPGLGISNQS